MLRRIFLVSLLPVLATQAAVPDGEALYNKRCGASHDGKPQLRMPLRRELTARTPESIYQVMFGGVMELQATGLSSEEGRAIARFISGKEFGAGGTALAGRCSEASGAVTVSDADWNGWSADLANSRYQSKPGLDAADVPNLKLKWAFAFQGDTVRSAQPAVVGGRLFTGSASGAIYSLGLRCKLTASWDDEQMARMVPVEELFKGRHFDREIVVLCVRWYLSFKLSYRDLVTMMTERGIDLAHTTILRWVQHYTPEFAKRWNRYARPVGGSWRCDETYIKVKGVWVYLYRAVDKAGKTVEFYLSRNRDVNAATAFLRRAIKSQRMPVKITLDAYAASHRAVVDLKESGELSKRVRVRSNKYLNNLIEQDHRRVKQRLRPMLGLKSFQTAEVVISGIELVEKIKKGQYKIGKLGGRTATMPAIWQAALAA